MTSTMLGTCGSLTTSVSSPSESSVPSIVGANSVPLRPSRRSSRRAAWPTRSNGMMVCSSIVSVVVCRKRTLASATRDVIESAPAGVQGLTACARATAGVPPSASASSSSVRGPRGWRASRGMDRRHSIEADHRARSAAESPGARGVEVHGVAGADDRAVEEPRPRNWASSRPARRSELNQAVLESCRVAEARNPDCSMNGGPGAFMRHACPVVLRHPQRRLRASDRAGIAAEDVEPERDALQPRVGGDRAHVPVERAVERPAAAELLDVADLRAARSRSCCRGRAPGSSPSRAACWRPASERADAAPQALVRGQVLGGDRPVQRGCPSARRRPERSA
jgi:hypothetical protein